MVVFDATILMLLFRPDAGQPVDSEGNPITDLKARVDHLVAQLQKSKTKIVVPTPAMSEALVRAGLTTSERIVEELNKSSVFRIAEFDILAAIEVAAMTRDAIDGGDKRGGGIGTWAKIKYDRQIVAIARVARAQSIYSDDDNVRTFATKMGIPVIRTEDLPLPPEQAQKEFKFNASEDELEAAIAAEEAASQAEQPSPSFPEDSPGA